MAAFVKCPACAWNLQSVPPSNYTAWTRRSRCEIREAHFTSLLSIGGFGFVTVFCKSPWETYQVLISHRSHVSNRVLAGTRAHRFLVDSKRSATINAILIKTLRSLSWDCAAADRLESCGLIDHVAHPSLSPDRTRSSWLLFNLTSSSSSSLSDDQSSFLISWPILVHLNGQAATGECYSRRGPSRIYYDALH